MTLNELKEQYAKEQELEHWQDFLLNASAAQLNTALTIISKAYAKAKLEEASERAGDPELDKDDMHVYLNDGMFAKGYDTACRTIKQSITNTPLD